MIKENNKIYTLGGLFELFMKRLKPIFKQIKPEKTNKSIDEYLFGKKTEGEKIKKNELPMDSKERFWIDNFYYYVDILNSFERLYMSYAFLCKFPEFRYYNFFSINQFTWVRYHVEFYLQENYILKERTTKWLRILRDLAKRKSEPEIEKRILFIRKNSIKAFKNISQVRGTHVHNYRFEPKEFTGMDTLNLLISKGKIKKLKSLRNFRLVSLTLDWKKTIIKNNKDLIKTYDILFRELKKALIDLEQLY